MDSAVMISVASIIVACMLTFVESETPPVMHETNRLRNRDHIHDQNHINEHLDGIVDMKQNEDMSTEERQFHYFKIHDYDQNNKLDGIELIAALTHFHKEEDPENSKPLSDDDLATLVDTILKEDDANNDGYVDYTEFVMSQRD